MNEGLSHIPLCLTVFVPLDSVHSVSVFQLTWTTSFTLQKTDGCAVFINISSEFLHIRNYDFRSRPICMISNIVYILYSTSLSNQFHRLTDILTIRAAASECSYLCLRVNLLDGFCCPHEKVGIKSIGIQILSSIRLIPHLPHSHLTLVALYSSLDISQPTVHDRSIREQLGIEVMSMLGINWISIAQTHPRVYSFGNKTVHVLIKPLEIVLSFLLFCLSPSALKPSISHSSFADKLSELWETGIIPVHGLNTDTPE